MWEIDIIIQYKYRKFLMYIKENITSSPNYNKKGVFAIIKLDNTAILSIAMLDVNEALKKEIATWIAESIVFSEKEQFIKQKKLLPNNHYRNAFLKALIMVGIEEDIECASSKIDLSEPQINLHSFFCFRLTSLQLKWGSYLEKILPENKKIDNSKLIDILKEIINSTKKDNVILLHKNSDNYILEGLNSDIYITSNDEFDAIANLILLSPSKIEIQCIEEMQNDSIILLNSLFNTNINE